MTHRRIMMVVPVTNCKHCLQQFSAICMACDCCEKCHLDVMIQDKKSEIKFSETAGNVVLGLVLAVTLFCALTGSDSFFCSLPGSSSECKQGERK